MLKLYGSVIVSLLLTGNALAQTEGKERVPTYSKKDGKKVSGYERKKADKDAKKPDKDTKTTKKN